MYYQAIAQCTQAVKNVEVWLDKAEERAAAKNFDVGVLMSGRLTPDMPFTIARAPRRTGRERRMMCVAGGAAGAATLPRAIAAREVGVAGAGAQATAASRRRSRSLVARS